MRQMCPLLVRFEDAVGGSGFSANVKCRGRALLIKEDDGFWMYGVNPGALAESSQTEDETYLKFRRAHTQALNEFASEANGFNDFKTQVKKFFETCDKGTSDEWMQAVLDVRAGKVGAKGIPKGNAEEPVGIEITERVIEPANSVFAVAA